EASEIRAPRRERAGLVATLRAAKLGGLEHQITRFSLVLRAERSALGHFGQAVEIAGVFEKPAQTLERFVGPRRVDERAPGRDGFNRIIELALGELRESARERVAPFSV